MWAVFHSYAITVLARLETALAEKQRRYRIASARYREKHRADYKAKWELDDAILLNKRLAAMADEIAKLEKQVRMVEPIAESYAGFRAAASREMSRRGQEQAPRD